MSDLGWIEIVGWERYQHADVTRTEGSPPWIKNYTRLMQDEDYLSLPVGTALILHRLWLEYASSRCRLRADTRSLTRRLNVRVTSAQLVSLEQAGFLRILASRMQAERKQDASASRAREEVEVEEDSSSQVESVASYDERPRLRPDDGQEEEEDWSSEPEPRPARVEGYDVPTLEQRSNIEGNNGMGQLSPAEVLAAARREDG